MFTATSDRIVKNVEHEESSEVIWVDREILVNGKITANCIPVAPWGDAEALVVAAKKIFRLIF